MPIDMALPLFRSKEDFIFRMSPQARDQALGPAHLDQMVEGRPPRKDSGKVKKQVTFADHRGLSLTRVKLFSEFSDPIDVPLVVQETQTTSLRAQNDTLVLDFAQPSSDYLSFRQNLDRNQVSLEHCVLKEKVLAGTVKVRNVSFEKSVKLRVTFDSWRTHRDVDCVYVKDAYPSSYSDTFSFSVHLPPSPPPPHQNLEFAVWYQVDGCEYWDSNGGENYRVVWSSMRRRRPQSSDYGIHFDRYGSPTCSHGVFPDWPSYAGYEDAGPYY